jgi:hypothetical protein
VPASEETFHQAQPPQCDEQVGRSRLTGSGLAGEPGVSHQHGSFTEPTQGYGGGQTGGAGPHDDDIEGRAGHGGVGGFGALALNGHWGTAS